MPNDGGGGKLPRDGGGGGGGNELNEGAGGGGGKLPNDGGGGKPPRDGGGGSPPPFPELLPPPPFMAKFCSSNFRALLKPYALPLISYFLTGTYSVVPPPCWRAKKAYRFFLFSLKSLPLGGSLDFF